MVLYDEKSKFLGANESFIKALGFEDIGDFLSFHSDVAELFVNQSGYIYNFENFSWIGYALHGGANQKRVIIKNRAGDETVSDIKIIEISLIGGDKNYLVIFEAFSNININISQTTEQKIKPAGAGDDNEIKKPNPNEIDLDIDAIDSGSSSDMAMKID